MSNQLAHHLHILTFPQVMGLNNGGSITKKTCADEGHWLGNTSAPYFTVIDTPGFGNNLVCRDWTSLNRDSNHDSYIL